MSTLAHQLAGEKHFPPLRFVCVSNTHRLNASLPNVYIPTPASLRVSSRTPLASRRRPLSRAPRPCRACQWTGVPVTHCRTTTKAQNSESSNAGLQHDDDDDEITDADVSMELNELSNEALRVMLADNVAQSQQLMARIDSAGEYLVRENLMDAATFMLVLRGMLQHKLLDESEDLKGPYRQAFEKMGILLEDSGWLLAPPESEAGNVEMLDDELIPPVLQRPYS